MKKLIASLFLILFLTITSVSALESDWVGKDYVTAFGTTDKEITVTWNVVDGADLYDVEMFHVEQNVVAKTVEVTENSITTKLPKSGHYIFRVRACNSSRSDCSIWVESIDPEYARVNDQPRAWWVYGYVAPPGPITIE
jgi:hypothetical protein